MALPVYCSRELIDSLVCKYWDWPLTAITGLEESPMYDGSDTSMSGNGEYIADKPDLWTMGVTLPAGSGGGCVYSGPFANYTVNLGSVDLALPGNTSTTNPHNDTGVLSWNPRCLKRDLTDYIIQYYNSATQVLDTILLWDTISDFQLSLQGINITTGANYLGPHGGGRLIRTLEKSETMWPQCANHRDNKNRSLVDGWRSRPRPVRLTSRPSILPPPHDARPGLVDVADAVPR